MTTVEWLKYTEAAPPQKTYTAKPNNLKLLFQNAEVPW